MSIMNIAKSVNFFSSSSAASTPLFAKTLHPCTLAC